MRKNRVADRVPDIKTFVSVFGFGGDILNKLAKAVEAEGGDVDDLGRIVSEPELCKKIAKLFARDLQSMIRACGFVYVDPDITEEHFPVTGPSAAVAKMFLASQKDLGGTNMRTDEIEAAIDRLGFRSATLAEQLVWAPESWNGTDLVVALGSSFARGASRLVPCLSRAHGSRSLDLRWADPYGRWFEGYRFLVVRK